MKTFIYPNIINSQWIDTVIQCSAIYNYLFGPTESQHVKLLEKNVTIVMQNQNLQQSFIETKAKANNITASIEPKTDT